MVDSSPRPPSSGRPSDAGLQQGLTRLDITAANNPGEGQWQAQMTSAQQPMYINQQGPGVPQQFLQQKHMSMPEQPVTPRKLKRNAWYGGPITPSHNVQIQQGPHRPSPEDSGSSDGVPTTPSTSQGNEYNPLIVTPNNQMSDYGPGAAITEEQKLYYTPQHQGRTDSGYQSYMQVNPQTPQQTYTLQPESESRFAQAHFNQSPNNDMAKLEALVAVATSEGSRAAEQRS